MTPRGGIYGDKFGDGRSVAEATPPSPGEKLRADILRAREVCALSLGCRAPVYCCDDCPFRREP